MFWAFCIPPKRLLFGSVMRFSSQMTCCRKQFILFKKHIRHPKRLCIFMCHTSAQYALGSSRAWLEPHQEQNEPARAVTTWSHVSKAAKMMLSSYRNQKSKSLTERDFGRVGTYVLRQHIVGKELSKLLIGSQFLVGFVGSRDFLKVMWTLITVLYGIW